MDTNLDQRSLTQEAVIIIGLLLILALAATYCIYMLMPPQYFVEFHRDPSSARSVAGAGMCIFLWAAYEYLDTCGSKFQSINAFKAFLCGLHR